MIEGCQRQIACICVVLWVLSLVLPAMRIDGTVSLGWQFLAMGLLGVIAGYWEWLANLVFWFAVLVILSPRIRQSVRGGKWVGLLLWALAWLSVARSFLPVEFGDGLAIDESGVPRVIEAIFSGYYCWIASLFLFAGTLALTGDKPADCRRP